MVQSKVDTFPFVWWILNGSPEFRFLTKIVESDTSSAIITYILWSVVINQCKNSSTSQNFRLSNLELLHEIVEIFWRKKVKNH